MDRIDSPRDEKAFAAAWRTHLDSNRSRLYKDVVAKSEVCLILFLELSSDPYILF